MIKNYSDYSNNTTNNTLNQEFTKLSVNDSATKPQSAFSESPARKNQDVFLPASLYHLYFKECEKTEIRFMPMAKEGKTPTYLPIDMPEIVLKEAGKEKALFRLHQMIHVKSILTHLDTSHLAVPKATTYRKFIIEERLPINTDSYSNIKFYEENYDLFVEPVQEMTLLFSRCYISCLVDAEWDTFGTISKINEIRYDNIPFYLSTEEGKPKVMIGLIDLERANQEPEASIKTRLAVLASIFPNHTNTIVTEATKIGMICKKSTLKAVSKLSKDYQKKVLPPPPSSGRSFLPS